VRRPLYLLVAGAVVLTAFLLFVVIPVAEKSASSHYSFGFADDYDLIARSLANGQGYRVRAELTETMMREPGYPLVLAGLFRLLGDGIEAARLGNLLMCAATALLLWHLALRVTQDRAASFLAVVIFLLHPGTVVAEARGGVEILFMLGTMGFMLLLYRAVEADNAKSYLLAGAALGAVVLVRSTPLLFPLALAPLLAWTGPPGAHGRRLAWSALLVAAMALVMAPWVARNYALSGQIVPTATVQGVAAQEGQYTCERLSFGRNFQALQKEAAQQRNRLASQAGLRFVPDYYQYFYTAADELAFNRALLQRTTERYREDPGLLGSCAAANLVHFWFLGKDGLATAVNVLVQLPLLIAALAGMYILWRRRPAAAWAPVALFVAYVMAVHAPIIAHARHSVPLVPFVAIFAGTALSAAWRRLHGARLRYRSLKLGTSIGSLRNALPTRASGRAGGI